jgi:hypothetical protein
MASNKYILNALIGLKDPLTGQDNNVQKEHKIELPKCKYQISIHIALKKLFSEDYSFYDQFNKFFQHQPLEEVTEDIEYIETQCQESLDGSKTCFSTQPNVELIRKGIVDLQDFSEFFIKENENIRCKEGFSDLMLASFAKLNNPTNFNILKGIFNNDVAPCAAYEKEEACTSLPMNLYEFQREIIKVAPEIATSFELHQL